jgi:hypothetical protein
VPLNTAPNGATTNGRTQPGNPPPPGFSILNHQIHVSQLQPGGAIPRNMVNILFFCFLSSDLSSAFHSSNVSNDDRSFLIPWWLFWNISIAWTKYCRTMVWYFLPQLVNSLLANYSIIQDAFLIYLTIIRCSIRGLKHSATTKTRWCLFEPKISKSWGAGFSSWKSPTSSWRQCFFRSFCMSFPSPLVLYSMLLTFGMFDLWQTQ